MSSAWTVPFVAVKPPSLHCAFLSFSNTLSDTNADPAVWGMNVCLLIDFVPFNFLCSFVLCVSHF